MKRSVLSSLIFLATLSSGCSPEPYDALSWGFGGTAVGGALGAGAGALVGSAIPNGAVAASAIFGGAVGAASGAVIGVSYAEYMKEAELREVKNAVENNEEQIHLRNIEIEKLRRQLQEETVAAELGEANAQHLYPGPTLGIH